MAAKVLVLFLFCAASAWQSFKLEGPDRAICSDGSTPLYFLDVPPSASRWLLYLPGGAACNNPQMCEERIQHFQGLTSSSLETGDFSHATGIFSRDCSRNPLFCEAAFLYAIYCSSDLWLGDSELTLPSGAQFYFRGLEIVKATFDRIFPLMSTAREVFLAGNSAGGIASFVLADRLKQLIQQNLHHEFEFRAIVDSAIFLPDPVFRPLECVKTMKCGAQKSWVQGIPAWNATLDASCQLAHSNEPWKCLYALQALKFVDTPVFVLQHRPDPCQPGIDGIYLNETSPAATKFKKQRLQALSEGIYELHRRGVSFFVSECKFHSWLFFEEEFLQIQVQGQTPAEAIAAWVASGLPVLLEQPASTTQECSDPNFVFQKHRKFEPHKRV